MAAPSSTSKPSATLPFIDANGGNEVSEPKISLPDSTVFGGVAAGALLCSAGVVGVAGVEQPLRATMLTARTAATSRATILPYFAISPPHEYQLSASDIRDRAAPQQRTR